MTYNTDQFSHTRPNVGVTVAPFIYKDGKIKVLVYKRSKDSEVFPDCFCLPNRFFDITEFQDSDSAAYYALEEKTNVKIPHMQQFKTFSGTYIDPERIVTVNICYYSILREDEVSSVSLEQPFETFWMNVEDALKLNFAFNHNEVLALAYEKMKSSAEYTTDPIHFLPEEFTIAELRDLVSLLLDIELNNSRFRDRVEKSGILTKCEGKKRQSANRPPQLFTFNKNFNGFFYPRSLTKASQ